MKYLAILLVCTIGFAAAATYGNYVPKAYFVIDDNGNPSPAYPINSETLNRARRQVQPFQFGQPQFGFPQFPQFPQPGQGQGNFVSTSQTLNSRFGEDDQVSGQTTFITSDGNKVTQTNTYLRPDGSTYSTQSRTKREQSQTQSQKAADGTQFQSQVQDGPGQQSQVQSQGAQHIEPVATPAVVHPVADNGHQSAQLQQGVQPQPGAQQPLAPQPGAQQPYAPQPGATQPHAGQPQGAGPQYPPQTENRNQQGNYPQGQGNYQPGFAPFGFGSFGPGGFPQGGFGFPQGGFGFPQAGFGGAGFGPGFGFPQAGFGGPGFGQPGFGAGGPGFGTGGPGFGAGQGGPGTQTTFTGTSSTLDNRFGEDEVPVVTGGTQTVTSQNGNFQVVTSVLKPNGQVVTTTTNGKNPPKKN